MTLPTSRHRDVWDLSAVHAGSVSQQDFPQPLQHCHGNDHHSHTLVLVLHHHSCTRWMNELLSDETSSHPLLNRFSRTQVSIISMIRTIKTTQTIFGRNLMCTMNTSFGPCDMYLSSHWLGGSSEQPGRWFRMFKGRGQRGPMWKPADLRIKCCSLTTEWLFLSSVQTHKCFKEADLTQNSLFTVYCLSWWISFALSNPSRVSTQSPAVWSITSCTTQCLTPPSVCPMRRKTTRPGTSDSLWVFFEATEWRWKKSNTVT